MYPNLTAEYEASGVNIYTVQCHANITEELAKDVLYGNEDLTLTEIRALYGLFSSLAGYNHYSLQYFLAPVLSCLDPKKPKTKWRTHILREKLDIVAKYTITDSFYVCDIKRAKKVYADLCEGNPVAYARYRHSIIDLDHIIRIESQPAPRGMMPKRSYPHVIPSNRGPISKEPCADSEQTKTEILKQADIKPREGWGAISQEHYRHRCRQCIAKAKMRNRTRIQSI